MITFSAHCTQLILVYIRRLKEALAPAPPSRISSIHHQRIFSELFFYGMGIHAFEYFSFSHRSTTLYPTRMWPHIFVPSIFGFNELPTIFYHCFKSSSYRWTLMSMQIGLKKRASENHVLRDAFMVIFLDFVMCLSTGQIYLYHQWVRIFSQLPKNCYYTHFYYICHL